MAEFMCDVCGSTSVIRSDLGQHICADCGTQSQEIMEEAAEDGMHNKPSEQRFVRTLDTHVERHATQDAEEAILIAMEKEAGVAISDDPVTATAIAYVSGMQIVLQGLMEVLVTKFGVSTDAYGVAGELFHAAVQRSEVLGEGLEREAAAGVAGKPKPNWVTGEEESEGLDDIDTMLDEEEPAEEDADPVSSADPKPPDKPRQRRRSRKVLKKDTKVRERTDLGPGQAWARVFSALERRLPNDVTLALAYLACFWLREPVLPTDIVRWALEGHLSYLGPLSLPPHIERRLRGTALKPLGIPSPRMIEFRAALLAEKLSLELPPINSHLVAARLIKDLGLPETVAVHVDRLLDIVTPRGFWISAAKRSIPPRAFVAAIIVVAVKLMHQLGGPFATIVKGQKPQLTPPPEVLRNLTPPSRGLQMPSPAPPLMTRPGEPVDLQSLDRYLRYCKDIIFRGAEPAADLKEYHAACENFFQGAVSAEAAQPRAPPRAEDADVAVMQREDCEVGLLKTILDVGIPMDHEIVHYMGRISNMHGHKDYVTLLRSAAAAIWVTPKGLHKAVREVELDLFEVERNLQKHLSEADTRRAVGG